VLRSAPCAAGMKVRMRVTVRAFFTTKGY
jgi:hypothetical protein